MLHDWPECARPQRVLRSQREAPLVRLKRGAVALAQVAVEEEDFEGVVELQKGADKVSLVPGMAFGNPRLRI